MIYLCSIKVSASLVETKPTFLLCYYFFIIISDQDRGVDKITKTILITKKITKNFPSEHYVTRLSLSVPTLLVKPVLWILMKIKIN